MARLSFDSRRFRRVFVFELLGCEKSVGVYGFSARAFQPVFAVSRARHLGNGEIDFQRQAFAVDDERLAGAAVRRRRANRNRRRLAQSQKFLPRLDDIELAAFNQHGIRFQRSALYLASVSAVYFNGARFGFEPANKDVVFRLVDFIPRAFHNAVRSRLVGVLISEK